MVSFAEMVTASVDRERCLEAALMNWSQLIFDLMSAGLSGKKIAERIDVAPTTLNALKNGDTQHPVWPTGDALIKLHARYERAGLIPRKEKAKQALNIIPHGVDA